MNIKQSTLAAAMTAALAMGVSGQAAADIYAGSSLSITNLFLAVGQYDATTGTITPGGASIDSFNYSLTNTAALNGVLSGSTAVCSGNQAGNNCGVVSPVLDALAANAPGSSITRTNNQVSGSDNTLTWFPIGGGDWSNSDSVIYTSQITSTFAGDPTVFTHTDQIAQSNISSASSASANAEIKSTTGFTFTFTVTDPGELLLSFDADPDMWAQILNDAGNAEANMNVSFTLSKDGVFGVGANWTPQGTAANDCSVGGGVTCSEIADQQDLNVNVGTSTNNTTDSYSPGANILGVYSFGVLIGGLSTGTWTLSLNAVTSTLVTRQVPEPGMLALMGIGLLGLGMSARRRKMA